MQIERSEEFELALKFIRETNMNIYLTGKAGAGKTTFLKYLKENPVKNMAVAAPTGVAAINAGGVTLHSMFHLPFGPFIPAPNYSQIGFDRKALLSRLRYNKDKIQFFNSLELLVIDEVSMVAAHTIDAIDTILRSVRHKQVPFGGVQILFIGDLHQLQPVIKDDEAQVLKKYYTSNFFFDSLVLKEKVPVMIELKKIFRQKEQRFIDILNGLRENKLTRQHLDILNGRLDKNFVTTEGDGYITLTTHNDSANLINHQKLKSIRSAEYVFEAEIEGDFPEHMFPADVKLTLKKNAQVMFIKNDTEEKKFFNGKIGIIEDISDEEIIVRCGEEKIYVEQSTWENITYTTNDKTKEIKEEVKGRFNQYPLRLAWAITIHKSQGLTFEKVVIDSERAFANGQVYVALSRATSLEGLVLTSPVNDRFLGGHTDFTHWKETHHNEQSLPILFETAKKDYTRQLIFDVFDTTIYNTLAATLKKETSEIQPEQKIIEWFDNVGEQIMSLNSVSHKFRQQLQQLWDQQTNIDSNTALLKRINDGAIYFNGQLTELKNNIVNHPFTISNYKMAKPVDAILKDVHERLTFQLIKLSLSMNFNVNELIGWKSHMPKEIPKVRSSYVSKRISEQEEKPVPHSELYSRLDRLREKLAMEEFISERRVFTDDDIKECCIHLPAEEFSLKEITGWSKKKLSKYAEEVLDIIKNYAEENSLTLTEYARSQEVKIPPTILESANLLKSGKNIKEISVIRKLKEATIEDHLAKGIAFGILDINEVLSENEIQSMQSVFTTEPQTLKEAHEKGKGNFTYGKLRMMQNWMRLNRVEH